MSILAIALAFAVATAHEHVPHTPHHAAKACLSGACVVTRKPRAHPACYSRPLEQGGPGSVLVCEAGAL